MQKAHADVVSLSAPDAGGRRGGRGRAPYAAMGVSVLADLHACTFLQILVPLWATKTALELISLYSNTVVAVIDTVPQQSLA